MANIATAYEKRRGDCCGSCAHFVGDRFGYGGCTDPKAGLRTEKWRRQDAKVCKHFVRAVGAVGPVASPIGPEGEVVEGG